MSVADLQKWMPRSDLLAIDFPAFGKWMLTLAASIFIVGAASTGTLNLISNYAVRPVSNAVPAPSPAALRSMEPIQVIAPAAAAEPAPAVTPTVASAPAPSATTEPAPVQSASAPAEAVPALPKMMATLSLAVRSHPQKGSPQVGGIEQGEIVTIKGSDHGWYLVTTSDGASGWSWGKYLEPVDPNVASDSPFWSAQGEEVAFTR